MSKLDIGKDSNGNPVLFEIYEEYVNEYGVKEHIEYTLYSSNVLYKDIMQGMFPVESERID